VATQKQIEANQRNAKKSTGATSPEGKETVSHNRTKHGLCGRFQVLPEVESQEKYDAFLEQLIEDEAPVGEAEIALVEKMGQATWCSQRALRMQGYCFSLLERTPEQAENNQRPVQIDGQLERYIRYQAAQDRAYQRASAELQKRKKERRLEEIGFESQKRKEAEEQRKQAAERRKVAAEIRKLEKHEVALATAHLRKQRLEMKLGAEIADALPPNFDPNELNAFLSASAPRQMTS